MNVYKKLQEVLYRQLYYTFITKYSLHFSVFYEKKTGKRVESMAVDQQNSTEWESCSRQTHTNSWLSHKDNLVKKRTLRRLGCVCVCVCQCWHRTHTPLSLSHYQLAFHPVSHPSVQMVRKAASVLSLSLILPSLYTLSFGEKKKKKVMPAIDWSQIGEGYRLDVRWI